MVALWVVIALLIVFLVFSYRKMSGYNQTIIFGSPSCGWCKKQLSYMDAKGLPYHFVDCNTQFCPDFVNGFPTMIVNNKIVNGYTEI
jgi:hypothetical protein